MKISKKGFGMTELKEISRLKTRFKVKQEYSSLVSPLSNNEYTDLKKSIREYGQYTPIIINQEGDVLDGHHRFKACQELALDPKTEIMSFKDELHEKLFVINCNLKRRHLNDYQKIVLSLKTKPILAAIAKKNMLAGVTLDLIKSKVDTNKLIGEQANVGKDTVRRVEYIQEKVTNEQKQKLNLGQKSINEVYSHVKKEEKRQELINAKPVISLPKGVRLFLGDFREKSKEIKNNSVDLVLTDPPFSLKYLHLYEDLAKLATRVLKVGGSLVMFAGQYYLDKVFEIFKRSDLIYWWCFCVKHSEDHQLIYQRQVFCEFKPMLWFVKGQKPNIVDPVADFIQSKQPTKIAHEFEQSNVEAEHVIERLSVENNVVFDPFCGSGVFGVAALRLKRRFIGIERDKDSFKIAKNNIGNTRLGQR